MQNSIYVTREQHSDSQLQKRILLLSAQSLCHVPLFATPWTIAHQAPLSRGILQARILEWVDISFRGSSQPRDQTQVSCIEGRCFTISATREAQVQWNGQPIPSPGELPDPGLEQAIYNHYEILSILQCPCCTIHPCRLFTLYTVVCTVNLNPSLFPLPFGKHWFVLYVCECFLLSYSLICFTFQIPANILISDFQPLEL